MSQSASRKAVRKSEDRTGAATPHADPAALPRIPARPGSVLAALDLGTNNCRLLIAEVQPEGRGLKIVDSFARIVRLGDGLVARGVLSNEAIQRAMDALGVCARKMSHWKVARRWAVTTEACRRASNGRDFIEKVRAKTGISLDIITPEREIQLAVKGCAPLLDPRYESALLFDIGGGSTELAWLERKTDDRFQVVSWATLPVGVVTLADSFGGRTVSPQTYAAMVDHVADRLSALAPPLSRKRPFDPARCHHLGTSGTVTTLAGVHLGLARYDRSAIDGLWLSHGELVAAGERLKAMDFEARAAHTCIGPDRADLVIAGYAILEAIHRLWPSASLRVADRGLREGMLLTLAKGAGRRRRRRAKASARAAVPQGASRSVEQPADQG